MTRGARRLGSVAAVVVALTLPSCAGGSPASAPAPSPTPTTPVTTTAAPVAVAVGSRVWVAVSVATLWTRPSAPRPVDAPALQAPVQIRRWLAAMSTTVRRGLVGRVETQALYGDPLLVTGVSGTWLHVVAPGQSTSRDRRGYPGWVPSRQVTAHRPLTLAQVATVVTLTTWLRSSSGARVLEASLGTRLPVVSIGTTTVTVATPTGGRLRVARSAVAVRLRSAPALAATRSSVLATARRFLGAPYLWGGRSGFAVDCSGFTSLVYAVHGRRLPRDADDQSWAYRAVPRATLGGDLTIYGPWSAPTHVAMYVGGGVLIQALSTGKPVLYTRVSAMPTPVRTRRVL
jgi:cell wall-associated NlpC family hydrolase